MGGSMSAGENNDELVDNLRSDGYIKKPEIERIFRIVDRAHYYLADHKEYAYKDMAWKSGTYHISAPCIYTAALDALEIEAGMSFLNLGSGTGYLSTMVGFLLGAYGVNHGVELHDDNVSYARERLEDFKQNSMKFDDLEFCEPDFVVGNIMDLPVESRLYDRVYCGAACPSDMQDNLERLLKVGGILVMPVEDKLLKVRRLTHNEFSSTSLLPVSFASLILPSRTQDKINFVQLPKIEPLSLRFLASMTVREAIRKTFDFKLPSPVEISASESGRSPRRPDITRQLAIQIRGNNLFMDSDSTDTDFFDDVAILAAALRSRRNDTAAPLSQDTNENSDEIDSDLSDAESPSEDNERGQQTVDNGNELPGGSLIKRKTVSQRAHCEDDVIADDEAEPEDDKMSEEGQGQSAFMSDFLEDNKTNIGDASEKSSSGENIHLPSTSSGTGDGNHSDSFQETTDDLKTRKDSCPIKTQSVPVHVSQPLAIKPAYTPSTSVDTSETSGFGSLMEDIHPPSLPNSFDSTSDGSSSDSSSPSNPIDKAPTLARILKRKKVAGVKFTEDSSSSSESDEDCDLQTTKYRKSSDDNNMETNDQDYDAENSSEAEEDKIEDGDSAEGPRGPRFSVFLKERVDSLPIPNSMKAYILHYRSV